MTVDLKWSDAMTDASWAFDVVERAAGWPESMTPRQLAAMQRPLIEGDRKSEARCKSLLDGIQGACASGVLVHEKREFSVPVPARPGVRVQRPGGRYVTLPSPELQPTTLLGVEW